jgi:hypothetical protein
MNLIGGQGIRANINNSAFDIPKFAERERINPNINGHALLNKSDVFVGNEYLCPQPVIRHDLENWLTGVSYKSSALGLQIKHNAINGRSKLLVLQGLLILAQLAADLS